MFFLNFEDVDDVNSCLSWFEMSSIKTVPLDFRSGDELEMDQKMRLNDQTEFAGYRCKKSTYFCLYDIDLYINIQ